ncbi:hypothetical protein L7F22_014684 [Adiantum nelumboides]|nr:hypothetical protein [Adiantum nelumboides]
MANAHVDDKSGSFRMSDSLAGAGMSSRSSLSSKIDSMGHHRQVSHPRDSGMLIKLEKAVENLSLEKAEPVEHVKPKQGALMRKLSWLISPKKKPPKSNARKHASPSIPEGGGDGKDHFEFLFAQAEATLGELLVKAGASFNARSTLQEDCHPHPHPHQEHHHESSRSNGAFDSASVRLGGSFNRSGGVAGHARRNSLSRVWQQLGGSLFCGSGHINALLVEDMERRGIAPMPQTPPATYFGDGAVEDMVADESYWQSLAESILRQRQKTTDLDLHAVDHLEEQNELNIKDRTMGTSTEYSVTPVSSSQRIDIPSRELEAECQVSEIMSVPVDHNVPGREEDSCRWAICEMTECSLEDSHNELLVPVEFGHGCTRLNTTLDASPNLAHNYQLHINNSRADNEGIGSSSSSKSVVDLLNCYSRPMLAVASASDEVVEPSLAQATASNSSAVCASSSTVEVTAQFSEQSLALAPRMEPNEINLDSLTNVTTSGTVISTTDSRAQKQPELANNSARVSLMVLLHEETVASVEIVDTQDEIEEVGQAQTVVPQEEERLVAEEPLALFCCVCMVRRKGAALIPCGHTFCRICSKQLYAGRGACPLCNNLIVQLLDIF